MHNVGPDHLMAKDFFQVRFQVIINGLSDS